MGRAGRLRLRHGQHRRAAQPGRGPGRDRLEPAGTRRRQDSPTGATRARREDHKQRIVTERGYLDLRLNHEDVAEFDYQPGKCARPYRVVALRKNISKARGEQVLIEEIRYFFYITTRTDLTPAAGGGLRQRALRPGEHHRTAQVRRERAAGAAVRPGLQLGLHGHRHAGLEPQVLVRADDAPQGRPARLHPDGVPPRSCTA